VFYRVDRRVDQRVDQRHGGASPFVVHTPAGNILVEGTSFRVAVTEAAAGRDAALRVTVYEGRVAVSGPRGVRRLAAGEHLLASAATSPDPSPDAAAAVRAELAALRARVAELEIEAVRLAGASPAPHGPRLSRPSRPSRSIAPS
jgi:ferric-dicitrate binding protein FerR (iron transport regulator)